MALGLQPLSLKYCWARAESNFEKDVTCLKRRRRIATVDQNSRLCCLSKKNEYCSGKRGGGCYR